MSLSYKLTSVSDITTEGYDTILVVTDIESVDKLPDNLKNVIQQGALIDKAFGRRVSVLPLSLPTQRLIFSGIGKINPEYDDVRTFGETAESGTKRALAAGAKSILLVLLDHDNFPKSKLVTLLGVMEALYTPIHIRETRPERAIKVNKLGIWSNETMNIENLIKVATALECGRIVARDIGGGDPERMAPPKIEEYLIKSFPSQPKDGVTITVTKDLPTLLKDYPLFAAVNRAANVVERHRGRIVYLTYEGKEPTETLLLVGKGVTFDTGGANIKIGGAMNSMSRDKCGAAGVAGFLKTVSMLRPEKLRVIGAVGLVRNSIGEDCYIPDEVIMSRSGKLILIGNTDAEGRMVMADILSHMKDLALKYENSHLMTVATLTGHACLTVGSGYSIALDNGPARKTEFAKRFQASSDEVGDMVEISTIRREDHAFVQGKGESQDLLQANSEPSSRTPRGHQFPAAFLINASGLDKHGLGSETPLKYTHLDIAAAMKDVPETCNAAPVVALSSHFLNISY